MRIAEVFTSGHYSNGDGCVCEDNFNFGEPESTDYGFESRNRPGGNRADFNDRDFPVPMFRGNRAGPIS